MRDDFEDWLELFELLYRAVPIDELMKCIG